MNNLSKLAAVDPGGAGGLSPKISNPALSPSLNSLTGVDFLNKLLPNLIGLGFVIGAVVFLFIMIIGAIQWTTSGGDKTALEAARSRVVNALIGIVLLFVTFAIVKLLETFFGINMLEIDLGPLIIN